MNSSHSVAPEFVNRISEVSFIMDRSCPPYLLINAPLALGKSWLLRNIKGRFDRKQWVCVCIDLDHKRKYSFEELIGLILNELAKDGEKNNPSQISAETAGFMVAKSVVTEIRRKRRNKSDEGDKDDDREPGFLLMIDNIEVLEQEVVRTLVSNFIPHLNTGLKVISHEQVLKVIFAGRYVLYDWKLISNLRFQLISLTPFTFPDVQDTIKSFVKKNELNLSEKQEEEVASHLMFCTGGHPGAMACILKNIVEDVKITYPADYLRTEIQAYYGDYIETNIIREINEYIQEEDLFEALKSLSVVRKFNDNLFKHFIKHGVLDEKWIDKEILLEDKLLRTYLVTRQEGFCKDDITQRALAIYLRKTDSKRFLTICKEAISFYMNRLEDCGAFRRDIIAVELLFQKLQYLAYAPREAINAESKQKKFFNDAIEVCKSLVSHSDTRSFMESFVELLTNDWDFRFSVNYLLSDDYTYDKRFFHELIEKLNGFIQAL